MQSASTNAVSAVANIKNIIDEISDISTSISDSMEEQSMATTEISKSAQGASDGTNSVTSNYGDSYRGEIYLNDNDDCFIMSTTASTDFPASIGAYQEIAGGNTDAILFSLNADMK